MRTSPPSLVALSAGRTGSNDALQRQHRRSSCDDDSFSRGGRRGGGGATRPPAGRGLALDSGSCVPVAKPRRRVKFKHVRINRMHARVNYEGYPVSISDFGLVLDTQVYTRMQGSWKHLLNRCVRAQPRPAHRSRTKQRGSDALPLLFYHLYVSPKNSLYVISSFHRRRLYIQLWLWA